MGYLGWIVLGALAGWIAGKLAGTGDRQGCLANIFIGIAGAFIGGVLFKLLTDEEWDFAFNPSSLIVAVLGSVVLLIALRLVRRD